MGSLLITQALGLHVPNQNKYTVCFADLLSSSNDVQVQKHYINVNKNHVRIIIILG